MTPECKPSVWTWTDSEPFWNLSSLFFLETLSAPFSNDIWAIIPAAAKSLQSCQTLCNPIDGSPPGSPVPGILQARTLERVAISFSNAGKWEVKGKSLSHVQLFATPRTAAHQASRSMGFSKQEYWSGVPLPSPFDYIENGNKIYFGYLVWTWIIYILIFFFWNQRIKFSKYIFKSLSQFFPLNGFLKL